MHLRPHAFYCLSATLLWVCLCGGPVHADQPRPNFIIILADDLGYGDIACYGSKVIDTPHLDKMAAEGLKFTDFHASGPVCSPTRAGLLTGRYQQRVGVPGVVTVARHREHGLDSDAVTFAQRLKKKGYATAIFGKWHVGYLPKFNPIRRGFDRFRGYVSGNVDYFSHIDQGGVYDWWDQDRKIEEEGYVTQLITKHSVAFIEQHKDRPFCLYVAHEAPHYPYQGPNDKADRTVGGKFPTLGSRKDKATAYKEMIEDMDDGIGQILSTLGRLNLAERTFVFFFSDNGATPLGSNGPLRGHKGSTWEGGHRVPAIAWWPGRIKAGSVTDELTISLDLFPTMMALAGAQSPADQQLDGVNLAPLMLEGKPIGQRTLFWRLSGRKAVRHGDWKLVVGGGGKRSSGGGLFNLADDLGERKDLSKAEPRRLIELKALLGAWEKEVGPDRFGS